MAPHQSHGDEVKIAPLVLAAASLVASACTTEATAILVIVDTDIRPDLAVTLRVTVRAGDVSIADGRRDVSWDRIALDSGFYDGGAALPASFGVTPSSGSRRDQQFTLLVEAITGRYTVRRVAHLHFTPGRSLRVPIYLAARCAEPASDCSSVPAAMCTVQQSCEDRMQTCGASGMCVPVTVEAIDPRDPTMNGAGIDAAASGDGSGSDASGPNGGCGVGGACCSATHACAEGEICTTLETCAVCGDGHACCASGTVCPVNAVCAGGTCRPCGGPGQACCDGETCGGGACVGGICETACGAPEQACCASGRCGTNALCNGGTCTCQRDCTRRCGGASDGCGGTCNADCGVGYICLQQQCRRCGVGGFPCCPGADCSDASQTNYCCDPSTEGRPTCPLGGSDGMCHLCGEVDQPCCPHQTCNGTGQSTCGGTAEANNVICRSQPCGVAGGFCCSWRIPPCESPLECDWPTGRCLAP
jgi:hypothetical protein